MRIDWFSQTGSDRANNCDAACYGLLEQAIAIAIVDAAESEKAQEFASYWAKTLVAAANTSGYSKDSSGLLNELENAQAELRHTFLHEIASYAMAVIHPQSGEGALLSAGDCLVGISAKSAVDLESVSWLNPPHTADRQMSQMGELPSPASGIEHVLTRSINAKRFVAPDITGFSIREGQKLVMASDGCWREPASSEESDDSSRLSLTWKDGRLEVHQTSDTENLGTYKGFSNS